MCKMGTKRNAILAGLKALSLDKQPALSCDQQFAIIAHLRKQHICVSENYVYMVVRDNFRQLSYKFLESKFESCELGKNAAKLGFNIDIFFEAY